MREGSEGGGEGGLRDISEVRMRKGSVGEGGGGFEDE